MRTLLCARPISAKIHWRQSGTSALVERTVSKCPSVFCARMRSAHKISIVKHATPHPWCICLDSRDFALTNTSEDGRIVDLQRRELHGRRFESTPSPSPSPLKRQIASLHGDGMPKFTASCSDVMALACANFSCVAHMISSKLCRVRRERLCVA